MHIGQPIQWEKDGKEYVGIVKEVLPAKGGVVAYIRTKTQKGMSEVVVKEPHKIRDAQTAAKVLALFKDTPEAKQHYISVVKNNYADKVIEAKHKFKPQKPKLVEPNPQTFVNTLADMGDEKVPAPSLKEILGHEPTVADWIYFHGKGIEVPEGVLPPPKDPTKE